MTSTEGALGLLGAVGDAFAGRPSGFAVRRAALAARFARYRGADDTRSASNWIAGATADTGLLSVIVPRDTADRVRVLAIADAPLHAARFVRSLSLPADAADVVRWHREHDDGTGFPDRLRWAGIPEDAAALGIVTAFLENADAPDSTGEALFSLIVETGRRFRVELVRAFRAFVTQTPDWETPLALELGELDPDRTLAAIAARIDARDDRTAGSSERLAASAATLATALGIDPAQAIRLTRLHALGRAAFEEQDIDAVDPLSRFSRGRQVARARHAAAIAGSVPAYAADAPLLLASAVWHEEGSRERVASIVGLTVAAAALDAVEAPRRIAAAGGTQFDPEVVRVYLATLGAPT